MFWKSLGIKKGDRVSIYLPMIAEALVVMLACARIGRHPLLVFGGFSAEALRDRINDCEAKILVTCDGIYRALASSSSVNADKALEQSPSVKTQIVVKRTGMEVFTAEGRDVWHEDFHGQKPLLQPEEMDAKIRCLSFTLRFDRQPKGVVTTGRLPAVRFHDAAVGV